MLRPYWSLASLIVFEQHNPGESLEPLTPLLRREQSQKPPEPRHLRRAVESHRFVEHGAVLRLAPSRGREERGALFGCEPHRRVARTELIAPGPAEELQEGGRAQVA